MLDLWFFIEILGLVVGVSRIFSLWNKMGYILFFLLMILMLGMVRFRVVEWV